MSYTETLKQKFGAAVTGEHRDYGDETVFIDRARIHDVLKFLRDEQGFDLFLDLCGVDYKGETPRFEVVYHLYALGTKGRLRLRVKLPENDPKIASVMDIWEAADWFEREAFDMFGIVFEGHPYLKRLMMWDEFEGHPLRKDYPYNKRQAIPEPKDIL